MGTERNKGCRRQRRRRGECHPPHTHRNTHFVLATWDRDYKGEEGLMLAAWRVPPAVPAVWGIVGRVPQAGDTVAVSIVKRLERLSRDMRVSET